MNAYWKATRTMVALLSSAHQGGGDGVPEIVDDLTRADAIALLGVMAGSICGLIEECGYDVTEWLTAAGLAAAAEVQL